MANPYIGRLRSIGLGKETTKGTAVTPTHWIPLEDGAVQAVAEIVADESSLGRIESPVGQHVVSEDAATQATAVVRSDWIGLVLKGLLGTVSTAAASGETIVYDHNFTVTNDNNHASFTSVVKDGVTTESSAASQFNSLSLSVEARDLLKAEFSLTGRKLTADSETVSYAVDKKFRGQDTAIKIEDAVGDLAGGSAIGFSKFEISIDNNTIQHYIFGSDTLDKNINTKFTIQGTLEKIHENNTYRDYYTDGTTKALEATFTNPDTIGTAENAKLRIQLANVSFTGYEQSTGNDDVVMETIEFTANFDATEAEMINVLLTNLETSY